MAARPRILFLTLYPGRAASPRYRVLQFLPFLESQGFDCTVASALSDEQFAELKRPGVRAARYHAAEMRNRLRHIFSSARYDVVFLQKAVMSAYVRGIAALLALHAPTLVMDLDDAVHLRPPHPLRGAARLIEDRRQIEKLLKRAGLVLAGNEWLRATAARWTSKAVTFPTVVDTERYVPATSANGTFCIGWIGSPSTFDYVSDLREVLEPLAESTHFVGASPERVWRGATVTPWTEAEEVRAIQSFSAGIMPLRKDDWCRGKCALKALQYMACGVPCVATPWGAACDLIEHNVNGLLAESPAEWCAAIEQLRDPAERNRLGEAGRATVETNYSLQVAAPKLADYLRSAIDAT